MNKYEIVIVWWWVQWWGLNREMEFN